MGIALFIIFALLVLGALGYSLYKTIEVMNNTVTKIDFKRHFITLGICMGAFALTLMGMFLSIYPLCKIHPSGGDVVYTIFGSLGFGALGFISLHAFLLHYYGKKIPDNIHKILFKSLMISFPIMFIFVFLLTNGFADYFHYPLYNGINFQDGFVSPATGDTNIAFYALCILSGALYVYWYIDHKYYIQYGKHGIMESTFLVAFPAGVLGARIFYVLGAWDEFGGDFGKMVNMADGGLTILGGAATGLVVGSLWFIWRRKGYSLPLAFDIVAPTILFAQAVGRWGNFFNCEVHGVLVNENAWRWLPKVVFNNAHYSDILGYAPAGKIFVPLFFVESLINLFGFFFLAHLFGIKLRKYTEIGDLGFGYIVWYGLTRVILEPLRYYDAVEKTGYKMGFWSWIWSFVFVIVGVLCIVGNHLIRYYLKKKKGEYHVKENEFKVGLISSIIIGVVTITFVIIGICLMMNGHIDKSEPLLNTFNVGLIFLTCGISTFTCLGISIPKIVEGRKAIHA